MYVVGEGALNRACDGDTVVVQVGDPPMSHLASFCLFYVCSLCVTRTACFQPRAAPCCRSLSFLQLLQPQHWLRTCEMPSRLGAGNVRSDNELGASSSAVPCARVVGVLRRGWREYAASCARIEERRGTGIDTEMLLVVPMDSRVPKIRIRTRQVGLVFPILIKRFRFLNYFLNWAPGVVHLIIH